VSPRNSRTRLLRATATVSMAMSLVWVLFVLASLVNPGSLAWAQTAIQNVVVNGVVVGRVELFNLVGNRGLNVRFHPANNDLNVINIYRLNWWQAVNRPQDVSVPDHIDTINESSTLPGVPPGDDNDPSYYTNDDRTSNGFPGIFDGGNWWMIDFPGNHNNIRFETWLVRSGGGSADRLVCFNWGFATRNGGHDPNVTSAGHPSFINEQSIFNLNKRNPHGDRSRTDSTYAALGCGGRPHHAPRLTASS